MLYALFVIKADFDFDIYISGSGYMIWILQIIYKRQHYPDIPNQLYWLSKGSNGKA